MKVYKSVGELVGRTPLLQPKNIENNLALKANLILKLEYLNPAGSAKDRVAKFMIDDAISRGLIKNGGTVIEPTSGNTGIGLASICASLGLKVILTMPDSMSLERRKLLKAYGAEVVLTDGKLGMQGAVEKAKQLNKTIENSFIAGQFDNPSNVLAHYLTTGKEIWDDTDGKVDVFVACIGTGGTISGVGKYLKEKNNDIKIIGVEPLSSPLINKGVSSPHKIQGIGANFIPKNYDDSVVDEVICASDEDAFNYSKILAKTEGVFVGISSGAALSCAIKLAQNEEYKGKNIVALMPDTGDRYLSTELVE